MKTSKTMISLLAAAAICASPAYANWFSNPRTGINLNIGSAPNPTPANLRGFGSVIPHSSDHYGEPARLRADSYYQQTYSTFQTPVAYDSSTIVHRMSDAQMTALEGKPVIGAHGARLGYILAVDHGSRMAEIQTRSGIGVAIPTTLLSDKGNHILAPTTSRGDLTAMAKTQTGRTMALNVDMRARSYRG